MKGMNISDTFWTLILTVFVAVMIILATFIWPQITLPFFSTADPVSYSIEFVHVVNKPFMIAEVLGHVKFDDRTVFEQSIEASVTSMENADAGSLPRYLSDYLDSYGLREYKVSIANGNNILMSAESTKHKCGDEDEPKGWCVLVDPIVGDCGTGRVEINPARLKCPWALVPVSGAFVPVKETCCKEDIPAYEQLPVHNNVKSCGAGGQGVCSKGERPFYAHAYELMWGTSWKYKCEQNRVDLGNPPECGPPLNEGNTRACCAPMTTDNQVDAGIAVRAIVPLLYKRSVATLEVTAR